MGIRMLTIDPSLTATVDWSDPFWSQVHPEALSGCWLWHGRDGGTRGYGKYNGRWAHRVAYERAHGPIPSGLFVLHRCDVPACVNPNHLWLGTAADNARDMREKGRSAAGAKHGLARHPERRASGDRHPWRRDPRLAASARAAQAALSGEAHPNSRFTSAQIAEVKRLRAEGLSFSQIARATGVSRSVAHMVCAGKAWRPREGA